MIKSKINYTFAEFLQSYIDSLLLNFRSVDDNKNDNDSAEARAQKERSISNLRNKDRPSLQIYQPSKRRTSNSTGPDNSCENKNRTEYDADATDDNNVQPSTSSSSSRGHDNRKRNDKKDSAKGQCDDSKKSTTEKRISRYSEKRNKVREKRDLSDNPTAANDSSSNTKGPTDDMS